MTPPIPPSSAVPGPLGAAGPAVVLHGPRDLRAPTARTAPVAEQGEVLVRVRTVGLCGSDLHYYEHGENGPNVLRSPTALGHEAAGTVVAAGPGAGRHPVGTRVAIEPAVPCGRCDRCRAGHYNQCADGRCFGSPPTHGALLGLLAVPEDFVHPLPEGMSFTAAAVVEPLAVALHALRRAGVGPGDRVLVTGAGPIGLLVLQAARASGAARVTVSDVAPARLAHARRLGADEVVDVSRTPLSPSPDADPAGGYDVLLECSGAEPALRDGVRTLRRGGTVAVVGNPARASTPLPLAWMQRQELNLVTAFRYAGEFPAAIALAGSGRVDLESLVTARFAHDESPRALETALADKDQIKVVIEL